jgi:hypothetical protein
MRRDKPLSITFRLVWAVAFVSQGRVILGNKDFTSSKLGLAFPSKLGYQMATCVGR